MTGITRHAARPLCALGLISITVTLVGCSTGDKAASLPPPSNSTTTLPSDSNKESVKHAYTSFIAMLDHADSLPQEDRKQKLSALMVEPQLSRVLKRIEELRSKNLTSYGKVVVHVTSVEVNRNNALLRDCQDSSRAGIMNKNTQKKINRGVEKGNTKAYLVKDADGHWRVSKYVVLGEGC